MLWFIVVTSVWGLACLLAVSLCVMARRGDDALASAPRLDDADVPFVATLAVPEPATPRPVAPPTSVR